MTRADTASSPLFDLPPDRAEKALPALLAADEAHLAEVVRTLAETEADLEQRLAEARRGGGPEQALLDRDLEAHRLTARLRTLRRYGADLCLGRMVPTDGGEAVYVGRLGLAGRDGRRLLVDWRSPAAEPFFGATHGDPQGLACRRRYRWSRGRVVDYWDEVFDVDGLLAGGSAQPALDDQSAFIASLGSSRTERMRDVLATIQSDQDAIVRAGSTGTLVVDGGPGTGKTVVALHRTAYLLYADPRLGRRTGHRSGGVLVVGPHRPYLAYVSDVLPSLGEEGVRTCTLRDLVPGGEDVAGEADSEVARLKATRAMVEAVEPAVRFHEQPPTVGTDVSTPWCDVWLGADDWADAFGSADPAVPHNEVRDEVWEALVAILLDKAEAEVGDEVAPDLLRRAFARDEDLVDAFTRAWPMVSATDLVGDLWSVPAYLRLCAPWLAPDDVRRLQRSDPHAWTVADLPLLDAARLRLGDPDASRRRRRREAEVAAEQEERARVVDHLVASDDSDMQVMSMLRVDDLRDALVDPGAEAAVDPEGLAGPFAHVVVDEAQELTDAEWQMVLRRCPSRSLTVVGDRAQARAGFAESWEERLARVGLDRVRRASLTVNYRTPAEVMEAAEPVIRAAVPDANVPRSVRRTGVPVEERAVADLDAVLAQWRAAQTEGTACVIGAPDLPDGTRVRSLTPATAKGLEFDLVVLVGPDALDAVDRYVAMTRATQRLVVLT